MRLTFALALLVAAPAGAEESLSPLDLARQASAEGPLYAYDMTLETSELTASGKIDPAQPEGSRVTIYSPAKEDWPEDFEDGLKEIDAEADGDIWCSKMAKGVSDTAELLSDDGAIARYAFKPKPEDKEAEKFTKHLSATIDIDVNDGAVLGFSMFSKKAFKPNFMVKVKSFHMETTCARAPDGRTYAAEVVTEVSASAAMQTIEERSVQKITALYPTGS